MEHRAKSSVGAIEAPADIGPPPRLEWIEVDKMIIDRSYQREESSARIRRIARAFNWRHFQPVTVTLAGDQYAVIDGQHRIAAAKLVPQISKLPAYIVDAPEVRDQAGAFITTNKERAGVTPLALFWAGITAQNTECIRVLQISEAAGVTIAKSASGDTPPLTTSAIVAVQRAVRRYGDKAARRALSAIAEAHPQTPSAFGGVLVASLTQIFHDNAETVSDETMIAALIGISPRRFTDEARATGKAAGISTEKAMRMALVKTYNQHIEGRAGRLPKVTV